jgi:hypothetical protein
MMTPPFWQFRSLKPSEEDWCQRNLHQVEIELDTSTGIRHIFQRKGPSELLLYRSYAKIRGPTWFFKTLTRARYGFRESESFCYRSQSISCHREIPTFVLDYTEFLPEKQGHVLRRGSGGKKLEALASHNATPSAPLPTNQPHHLHYATGWPRR